MADMTRIKGRIAETIYPNGTGAITAESHQALLLEMVDTINREKADQSELVATQDSLEALTDTVNNLPLGGGDVKADGVYPDLTAGDLAGRGESVPAEFGFRASGGKSIKDGRAYIKRIKGNSVVWNQIVPNSLTPTELSYMSIIKNGNSYTFNVSAAIAINQLSTRFQPTSEDAHIYLFIRIGDNSLGKIPTLKLGTSYFSVPYEYNFLTAAGTSSIAFYPWGGTSETISEGEATYTLCLIDLTKMFQAGNEPTTIEEFNARVATLGIDMYAYNEGQVIHCNTERIKSVGDNAFNGVWYQGGVSDNDGNINTSQLDNLHTDTFRVIGGETYCSQYDGADLYLKGYFFDKSGAFIGSSDFEVWQGTKKWVAPINADSVRMRLYNGMGNITPSQAPNVMITLVHSGWKQDTDAGYQPYWQDILPLPIISKYFPDGMKKAGSAHDEIRYNKASGKWEYSKGKIKSVDMGSMAWSYDSANQVFTSYTIMDLMTHPTEVSERNKGLLCSKYSPSSTYIASTMDDKSWLRIPKSVTIKDTSYTDAATFKADMAGVILYYEAAEWEWVELDAEDQNFRDYYNVADFGTEEAIPATDAEGNIIPSANFSADIIYQFNAVDMIREHELEITELQNVIATMQAQLTSLINGGQ